MKFVTSFFVLLLASVLFSQDTIITLKSTEQPYQVIDWNERYLLLQTNELHHPIQYENSNQRFWMINKVTGNKIKIKALNRLKLEQKILFNVNTNYFLAGFTSSEESKLMIYELNPALEPIKVVNSFNIPFHRFNPNRMLNINNSNNFGPDVFEKFGEYADYKVANGIEISMWYRHQKADTLEMLQVKYDAESNSFEHKYFKSTQPICNILSSGQFYRRYSPSVCRNSEPIKIMLNGTNITINPVIQGIDSNYQVKSPFYLNNTIVQPIFNVPSKTTSIIMIDSNLSVSSKSYTKDQSTYTTYELQLLGLEGKQGESSTNYTLLDGERMSYDITDSRLCFNREGSKQPCSNLKANSPTFSKILTAYTDTENNLYFVAEKISSNYSRKLFWFRKKLAP